MQAETPRPAGQGLVAIGGALVGSVLAVVLFSSTGQDDCHITFWAARALAEFGEILNHSGERVEQSSSLLHTLLLAGLHRVSRVPLPWLSYGLGILAAVASIARLPSLARALGWSLPRGALLVLGTSPAFAYWQLGGLESSLFTWCCVEFLIGLVRLHGPPPEVPSEARADPTARTWFGFLFWSGALASVRPEAGLLALGTALLVALVSVPGARGVRGATARRAWLAVAIPLGWFALLVALRLAYFGRAFPQPVMAKIGGPGGQTLTKMGEGLVYLGDRFASPSGALLVLGGLLGLAFGTRDLRFGARVRTAPLWLVMGYLAFIVVSGGDWMKGWRFVAHVEPFLALLLIHGLMQLGVRGRGWAILCTLLVAVQVHGMVDVGGGRGTGRPLWRALQVDPVVRAYGVEQATWPERANQVHTRDVVMVDEMNEVLGRLLGVTDRVSILSKQAGLVAYYAALEFGGPQGRIEFIDRLGLSSRHFDPLRTELGLTTGPMGFTWDLEDYFGAGAGRSEPFFHPDVIFDLHRLSADLVERLGFVVVYEQGGLTSGRLAGAGELAPRDQGPPAMELLRVRHERGRFRGKSPWAEETNMYQFIAVRADLAQRAGLVSVGEVKAAIGPDHAATAHSLYWNDALSDWLRDGGSDGAGRTRPPLLRVTPFESRVEALARGQRVGFDGSPGAGPRVLSELWLVGAEGVRRELRSGRDYRVRGAGSAALSLGWLAEDLGPAERLELRGLGVGLRSAEVPARVLAEGN